MDSSDNSNTNDVKKQGEEDVAKTPSSDKSKGKRKKDSESDDENEKSAKPKKATRSWVWEHFTRQKGNENLCDCHYSKKAFSCPTKQGTSNLTKHLGTCKLYKAWAGRSTQNVISQEGKLKDGKVIEKVFREASNVLHVLAELPLAFIECMAWKRFCEKCNLYKPHSRRTSTRDIVEMYLARKAALKEWLFANNRRVSLTTDIWTAHCTSASYMVITVHFVDAEWRLRKLILGFKYITDHKSKTISRVLLECLADWGIEKLFTMTVDNATANTSALKKFQAEFKLRSNDAFVLGGTYLHMSCCAHIINLIVNEGISELSTNVTAIRNGVLYVRSSDNRCDSFEQKVVSGKMTRGSLPIDVKTRWNLTYLMLTKAMHFKLTFQKMEDEDKLYNDYFMEFDNGEKRIGPPTYDDWRAIERLVKFLGLFYTSTLVVSASTNICSHKCYGKIVTIEKNLITLSRSYDKDLGKMATEMREKFTKYWDGVKNINKMLIVASVFDARKKMQFAKMCFEKLYGQDSDDAKDMSIVVYDVMKDMLKEYSARYGASSTQSSQSQTSSSSTSQVRSIPSEWAAEDHTHIIQFDRMDNSYDEMVKENGVADSKDELDIYLRDEVENPKTLLGTEWDVLSWWRLNSHKFPVLSEIARDVLAMQVSSVASESAFNTSGRIIEPHRSFLTHYMVEVLMCTEQWIKQDIKISETISVTNAQLLADIEYLDNLEKGNI